MSAMERIALLGLVVVLAGCEGPIDGKIDKTRDGGLDSKSLRDLKAGVWIDPNGCDHWIIDDGVEGYLSQRLDRNGKPVCSGTDLSGYAVGDFKGGSLIQDPI